MNDKDVVTPEEKQPPDFEKKQRTLYVDGSKTAYRCECGANVFTEVEERRYRCNGCLAMYRGQE